MDTFGLLAVILVFIFGFFVALLALSGPVTAATLTDEIVQRDNVRQKSQLYLALFIALAIGVGLTLVWLADLTRLSVIVARSGPDFPTVRVGLWFVDALLVVMALVCIAMI